MNEAIDYEKLRAAEYSLRIRYAYSLYMHQFYGGGGGGGGGGGDTGREGLKATECVQA